MQALYDGCLIFYRRRKTDLIAKLNKKERTKILHMQLMTYFRERVLDGRLPAGTRLPTDGELAAQYQITHDTSIQQLQADHIPVVLMDRYFPGLAIDYVGSDNVGGGYRATEHLLILGHRRIGYVFAQEETLQTTSVYERWQGYCKALQKYEVPYDESLVVPDFRQMQSSTREGLVEFLQRPDRPSAIFAVNDYVALDILQAAKALHLRIPEDLAVIGFDDLEFAAHG